MAENIKVVRGYYLTGLGQEPSAYYFKITDNFPEFEVVKAGDIALTFYQNGDAITSIPALIRVDAVIEGEKQVLEFLKRRTIFLCYRLFLCMNSSIRYNLVP